MKNQIRQSDIYLFPNLISASRIICAPLVIWLLYTEMNFAALVVFIILGLTDLADGYLARRLKTESRLGVLLDPLADKLIILSTMIMLLWLGRLDPVFKIGALDLNLVGPVLVIVTVGREIAVTGLRAMASSMGIVLPADRGGKIKTLIQFISICFLIHNGPDFLLIGQILLILSVLAAVWSGLRYFVRFAQNLPR